MDQQTEIVETPTEAIIEFTEPEIIGLDIICRLCANQSERIIGIYSEEGISNELAHKMNMYLPIKVSESDTLPLQCCWSCASTVLAWHELVVASVIADRRLRGYQIVPEKSPTVGTVEVSADNETVSEPEERVEHESTAASLNVFCQEGVAVVSEGKVLQKRVVSPRKKKLVALNALHIQLNEETPKEHWVKSDELTDDSLQNYIEDIQSPFIVNECGLEDPIKTENDITIEETNVKTASSTNCEITKPKSIKTKRSKKVQNKTTPKVPKQLPEVKNEMKEELITVSKLPEINGTESSDDDKPLPSEWIVKTDEESSTYNFLCQDCPSLFMLEEDVINHIKSEHPDKVALLNAVPAADAKMSKKERRKNTKIDQDAVNAARVVVEGRIYYICKICGKSLHSPYTYIWHMRIHTGERPYVCDLCGKQFRVSQGLVRHLRETHEGIKNFGCDLCGRMFATRRNVEEHRRIHTNERPYICDLCGKSFKQKASLFVHNRSHTDTFPFRCSYCNQGFRTRPPLMLHVTRHTGEKPYPCDICGRCFRIKYELKTHRLIHSDEKPFSCLECGLSFRQKRYLRNHNKINHNRSTPCKISDSKDQNVIDTKTEHKDENDYPFEDITHHSTDSEDETEEYRCSVCFVKFATEKCLNIHQNQKHGLNNSPLAELISCDICKKYFKNRNDMLKHSKEQHSEKSVKKRRRRDEIEYKIFCDICNSGFTRQGDMYKHKIRKHPDAATPENSFADKCKEEQDSKTTTLDIKTELDDGDSKMKDVSFKCEYCKVKFKKKAELNVHLQNEHGKKSRRYRRTQDEIIAEHFCDVCNKGFTRKFDMQKHRRQKHPEEPELTIQPTKQQKTVEFLKRCKIEGDNNISYYKCETCNRIFRQSYNFMRHQSIHTGVRAFFCHICGKSFRMSGGLRRHINEHHYGVKRFPCEICGRSFAAKATRDEHRNIHTNDRPFVCDVCGKAFKQKASLHIHKMFHSNNYRFSCNVCGKKYRRASDLKVHGWLHSGHKPHNCNICGSSFRLRQDLKRHLKVHDKLNECVCIECGSTFSQERYLKNHRKTHKVKNSTLSLPEDPLALD